ncbi:diaminopimelate epimerase [Riemerella columbipharyngis]|uniref:Diaminopimelate epimerase n=1 Tax=Riemerella columbipharyngis TaxID=1071918 RepID=A0A1G7AQP2_9FLAO|nr:diaminopimelate epimerase [Riemerella columbipharyngis]SDE17169.1 diaminopimelate epimerase [Riemerella columbipharyngis]
MEFYKYHGTGNDFIMVDNRTGTFKKTKTEIERYCHRRFGIGADGLILLENDAENDFRMIYYNSDGAESTMCGNGGRCIVAFAYQLGIFKDKCTFSAIDGKHEAEMKQDSIVKLKMIDVKEIKQNGKDFVLNTGSPHYVKFVKNVETLDIFTLGRSIRNTVPYKAEGINVNFVEVLPDETLFVRTYERGVENETYSCGTGVTAAALSILIHKNESFLKIKTYGGNLKVYAQKSEQGFKNIWLEGPTEKVFSGIID